MEADTKVIADMAKIKQVLSNLVSNAVKYSSDNTEIKIEKLSSENHEEIKSLFREIFMNEPWNDDWSNDNQLKLFVQIIDKYIGGLNINFAYRDGHGRIRMYADAEHFLDEYDGPLNAVIK